MQDRGDSVIQIDGSVLEGGGQILRSSVACAVILNRSVRVINIRAGRPKPGLSNQHLAGIHLAAELSNGRLSRCELGSTELTLSPSLIRSGVFEADAKTAGSVCLLLQVAVPILAYAKGTSALTVKGGTDALWAPPIDYISEVAFHYFKMMGLNCTNKIIRRGFYPQGGGIVQTEVNGLKCPLTCLKITELGSVTRITGHAFVAGRVPIRVAQEMKDEACKRFAHAFPNCPIQLEAFREDDQRCSGNIATFLFIIHTSNNCRLAASAISNPRGPPNRQLVQEAVDKLSSLVRVGACCDENMQDQLIMMMALASGKSTIRTSPLTLHTRTAIFVMEQMLPVKFNVEECANGSVVISCDGVGQIPS
ncbi:RNA terminal phosphate cyclase domain 1 [Fasciola gigantica]|uniref:RNA 3'-terminal phosphate cyclase n=1 Tax=Fasciola gigantica TaxID=46835 RepID=A0A504YWS3_FASGI|nr:RNA terminal phosphate cyclase domain 1 [Fasciola gigantica]